jgi:hypothetical protein
MGTFPMSEQCEYILVVVDNVSKWVEATFPPTQRTQRKCPRKSNFLALEFLES